MTNTNLTFRKYIRTDLPAMQSINDQNHTDRGGALFGRLDETDTNYYVALKGGELVAYANVLEELPDKVWNSSYFSPVSPDGVYIKQIAVAPDCQNQGVGSFLYEELSREYGDRSIYAHVYAVNENSSMFHFKSGFRPVGLFSAENYFGKWRYLAFLFERKSAAKI